MTSVPAHRRFRSSMAWACVALLAFAPVSLAAFGTEFYPPESFGKLTAEGQTLPKGASKLLRDPLRGRAWSHWFTEHPNDVTQFGFNVSNPKGVQGVIDLFSQIDSPRLRVILDPREEGFSGKGRREESYGVIFFMGNQRMMDAWYKRLPGVILPDGRLGRKFGKRKYRKPPEAVPPTLMLYVGHETVDLDRLRIPEHIAVEARVNDAQRSDGKLSKSVEQIERFCAARRESKRTADDARRQPDRKPNEERQPK